MSPTTEQNKENDQPPTQNLPRNTRLRSRLPSDKNYNPAQDTMRVLKSIKGTRCKCMKQTAMRKRVREAIRVQGDWLPAAKRFIREKKRLEVGLYRVIRTLERAERDGYYDWHRVTEVIAALEGEVSLTWVEAECEELKEEHANDKDGCKELDWFVENVQGDVDKEFEKLGG
ncbi:hypothetical protein BJY00DRAFT_319639 [Aspergillus carlsbadensis]|nr:hypothetical protein BJY00DRAFT_319639 [Aspergillus carlsbadensis]